MRIGAAIVLEKITSIRNIKLCNIKSTSGFQNFSSTEKILFDDNVQVHNVTFFFLDSKLQKKLSNGKNVQIKFFVKAPVVVCNENVFFESQSCASSCELFSRGSDL